MAICHQCEIITSANNRELNTCNDNLTVIFLNEMFTVLYKSSKKVSTWYCQTSTLAKNETSMNITT